MTLAQANAIFAEMASHGAAGDPNRIPFDWPADGCFARAHEMRRLMAEHGIQALKAWNFGTLHVGNTGIGPIDWGWHVAPTVFVQGEHGVETRVIDPSLFDRPVSPQEWAAAQGDAHSDLRAATAGEPAAARQQFDGGVYRRSEDMSWSERDDSYSLTQQHLEYYRLQREVWDSGIDPRTGMAR